MDIQLKHEDYKYLKIIDDNSLEECVEGEISLPEYMPEILRIIKSDAKVNINSCKLVGDRVTVDGVCEMRMIYTSEDGGLYSYSQSRAFTRYCESEDFENAADANCCVTVSYVNCKATGTKKAEIKAGLLIRFKVYKCCCEDIIATEENSNIQKKIDTITAMGLGCRKTRAFFMSDTVLLEEAASFVLNCKAVAVCTETRKINNKIMIKGEAIVDVTYVKSDSKTKHINHSIPINQILEFEGMQENFTGNVYLDVASLDVIPKGEGNSLTNAFDLSLCINASVTMWEEKEIQLIRDAYSISSSLNLKTEPYKFYHAVDEIRETYSFDGDFPVAGEGIEEIIDTAGVVSVSEPILQNGEMILKGNLIISVIIKDVKGEISNINKTLDFDYVRKTECGYEKIICKPCADIITIQCNKADSNSMSCKAEININCSVFGEEELVTVVDITESEITFNKPKDGITVYFPEGENESLWSIARRYNTTVSAIADENALEGETTEKLKMVFIPST